VSLWALILAVFGAPVRAQDYIVDEDVLIKTPDGATISAFVVRPKDESRKLPAAKYFHLSYTVQRASYAADMSERRLLTPNRIETIRLANTPLVSRQLSKGSRLLLVVDVNRGPFAQVNYGTGEDVSDEWIADAKEPLRVERFNDSYVEVPVTQ
jgi:predicted acyl esterase